MRGEIEDNLSINEVIFRLVFAGQRASESYLSFDSSSYLLSNRRSLDEIEVYIWAASRAELLVYWFVRARTVL
jgi:hypothetical protein